MLASAAMAVQITGLVPAGSSSIGSTTTPPELKNVGIVQKLNAQVPLNLQFKDENGKTVTLGDYFTDGRPVILNLVYYNCQMLCGEVLNGLVATAKVMNFTPGKQYEIVTVSIDPRETPQLAAAKKATYIRRLGRPEAAKGWHFLTGQKPEIDALANSIGWHYTYIPKTNTFAHAAGIVLVTPQGKVSQYYYGIEYSARDLRLGIIQSSQNKIGTLADVITLYCCRYDPTTGRYGLVVTNLMRIGGGATMLILGGVMIVLYRREKHDKGQGRA